MQSERHTTAREDTQSTRRCDAWLRIRNLWWQTQTRSTRRWEWKEEFFTNYVNRSVVVQILTGHEVKYRERIINGLRTREWGWVYEKKKKGMWTGYVFKKAYFSFIKVINAVLVKHFFQLSLGAGTVLLLAWKNCLISPLKQQIQQKTFKLRERQCCFQ